MNKFFATTPIYYANDVPHIGSTYTTVAADVLTRFHKQRNEESYLLTGTDEHGAKIAEAARKHEVEPQKYVDEVAAKFKEAWEAYHIAYSRFIRTTDEDHVKAAQEFLAKLYKNGTIEEKPRLYKGLYCVGCEKFLSPADLKDGLCPDHLKPPVEQSEENYYFKLSNYQKQLEELIESDQIKIRPLNRKNEILSKLRQGLEDISISRVSVEWGIPLPFDPSHTTYVWIEALINYYTFGMQKGIWPADIHLVGKDIIWFHAVIWPAMLLAINEATPKEIFAHGFFTVEGQKMSKSLGNVISPYQLLDKYGTDGARYVLLAAFPFGEDGDVSWEYFDRLYNADLANGLGNLVARVAKLAEKNEVTAPELHTQFDEKIIPLYENLKFYEAVEHLRSEIAAADKKINEEKPWELEGEQAKEVLTDLIKRIQHIAYNIQPFIPDTAEKIRNQFSGQIKSGEPLFPRLS